MTFFRDLSLSAIVAGFVTVLVGFTSSAVIVFEAARAVGANEAQIASWMWALGIGMGITCIGLSLRYRMPVVTAWSTPGAAMLITSAAGVSIEQATGAFVVSAVLILIAGITGWFERLLHRIPPALGAGMLVVIGVVLDRSTPESFAAFEAAAQQVSGCLECHVVTGEFDYVMMVRTGDHASFNRLHAEQLIYLPGVRQIRSFIVLREVFSTTELVV